MNTEGLPVNASTYKRRRVRLAIALAVICATPIAIMPAESGKTAPPAPAPATKSQYANTDSAVEYVGDEACRNCHSSIYDSFKQTGMGRSTSVPSAEEVRELTKPVTLVSNQLNRSYKAYVRDGKIIHEESETDAAGHQVFSETHEVAYTVGTGDMGKSYLVWKGDSLFVSPISYYTRIHGWDLSPNYREGVFHGFTRRAAELCVDCHTGQPRFAAGNHESFQQPPFRFLTVGCERCHGPGAIHVALRTMDPYVEGPIDRSIVNPRKLGAEVRDDICLQCHLAGDARVLQPGKDYLDFRPGTALGDIVAIYSVPQQIKGTHLVLLDQFEQLKLSRCWRASNGRLGCISCHDPHVQLHGDAAAEFYRSRCLTCHTNNTCTASRPKRQATTPPDNCVLCHMPQRTSEKIDHTSIADHRILRSQSEIVAQADEGSALLDLVPNTKPSDEGPEQNLRNLALAYAQAGARYAEYDGKAIQMLELAAAAFPNNAEVQATYGKALILTHFGKPEIAAQALQKAIEAGSKSAEVRVLLARLQMGRDRSGAAIELYKQAIQLDPYFSAAYRELAKVYASSNDQQSALRTLDEALKVDPGDDAAREERAKIAGDAGRQNP